MIMRQAPCYVIDGTIDVNVVVPNDHCVVGFSRGQRPEPLPIPHAARHLMITALDVELGPDDQPLVLLVIRHSHLQAWQNTPQSEIDRVVDEVLIAHVRMSCAGSA